MLALLLSLFLSTAQAACPIDPDHPIMATRSVATIGVEVWRFSSSSDRAELSAILTACNVGSAPQHLAAYSEARRKVTIRGVSGLVFWPIWLFVIGPAMEMSESRANLIAAINQ